MSQLDFERVYPHARDKVWRALTDAELLGQWLMPNDFEPHVGHEFEFRTDPAPGFDGIVRCVVLELREPELLRFSWKGGPIDTVVTFRLEDASGGTRLSFTQTGFRGFKQWLVRTMLKAGFRSMYTRKLPRVLAQLDGRAADAPPDDPAACGGPLHRIRTSLLRLLKGDTT